MGLACKIHYTEKGDIDFVENSAGQKSQLFEEARKALGDNTALDIVAVIETDSFKIEVGKQEPQLTTVLKYITAKNVEGQTLSAQEKTDLKTSLIATKFENSNELVKTLQDAFFPIPTLKSLKKSGVYTDAEAHRIVNNLDLQTQIKENLQKIINSDEVIYNDLDIPEVFKTVDVTTTDLIGKSKQNNPFINEKEVVEQFGGIKNKEQLEEELNNSDYKFLSADDVLPIVKGFKSIPAKIIENGELIDKPKNNNLSFFRETLGTPKNNRLYQVLDSVEGISPEVWNDSPREVETLFKVIQKEALEVGLDLQPLNLQTQEEVLGLTRALNVLMHSPSEINLRHFSEVYDEFYQVDNSPKNEVVKVEEKFQNKNLVQLDTEDTAYKTFKEQGFLKVKNGVYIKTDALKKSVDELYDAIYQNLEIRPELFTLKTAFKNKDMVIQDMKDDVNKEIQAIDIFDTDYDSDTLQKMVLYSKFFETSINKEAPQTRELIKTDKVSEDFVSELRVKQLKENNEVLNNLEISDKGVHLKSTDPISLFALKNYDNAELKNYLLQQKNTPQEVIDQIKIEQEEEIAERDNYINFPMLLEQFTGDYQKVAKDVLQAKGSENFIRVGADVFENVGDNLYVKLDVNDTNSIKLDNEQPISPEGIKSNIQAIEESELVIQHLYSASEGKKLDESLDNCS